MSHVVLKAVTHGAVGLAIAALGCAALAQSPPSGRSGATGGHKVLKVQRGSCAAVDQALATKHFGAVLPGAVVKVVEVTPQASRVCVQPFVHNASASELAAGVDLYLTTSPAPFLDEAHPSLDEPLMASQLGTSLLTAKLPAVAANSRHMLNEVWCADVSKRPGQAQVLSLFASIPTKPSDPKHGYNAMCLIDLAPPRKVPVDARAASGPTAQGKLAPASALAPALAPAMEPTFAPNLPQRFGHRKAQVSSGTVTDKPDAKTMKP